MARKTKAPKKIRAKKTGAIKKAFDTFKNKVLKTPDNKSLDNVDVVLSRVSDSIVNKDSLNQAELVRKVFSDTINSDVFKNTSSDMVFSPETIGRLMRYSNAEEICDMLPYCARALKIIANETIAPDKVTKESLQFLQTKTFDASDQKSLTNVRAINEVLKIEDYMYTLIYETLKLGDQFVEICDYKSKEVPITQSLLSEETNRMEESVVTMSEVDVTLKGHAMNEFGKVVEESQSMRISPTIIEDTNSASTIPIENVRLIIHDPRYIIKLQSNRFKMCLGYLVLPRPSDGGGSNGIPGASCGSSTGSSGLQFYGSHSMRPMTGIDRLYSEIITSIKKKLGTKELSIQKKEILDMLTRVVKEYDAQENLQFNIRYVPPERMEHFNIESRRFFPYGEGIFYKSSFSAKLLAVFETALVIKRVSDSSDKRVIYVESGLPRNVRNLIEELKESMQKRKFSMDTMGNISSVVSMITSYETYYIPQKQGKRYVEFDQIPSNINIRDLHDELKTFRDQLISSLDVPPAFVNVDENTPNKNALSHESMLFAKTIVGYQDQLSRPVQGLFSKIYKLVHDQKIPLGINITFFPPRMLEIERDAEHNETVVRLINALAEVGIDKEYLKRKYLSIDWVEHEEYKTKSELENKTEGEKKDEEGGGFGGGY